jgi:hypothetical protein
MSTAHIDSFLDSKRGGIRLISKETMEQMSLYVEKTTNNVRHRNLNSELKTRRGLTALGDRALI